MIFSLDVRRARKGDCLLLHFGTSEEPGLVMIDGGPKSVYQPHLKPRLKEIKAARGLGDQEPLLVDLLMVSHVDDDHIQGILELTKEELEAKLTHQPQLLNVQSFWHNSFDEIIDHSPDELTASVTAQFGAAAVAGGGELSDDRRSDVELESDEHPKVVDSGLRVLASIEQGFRLRQNADGLGFPLNPEFGGKLILAGKDGPIDISDSLKFTVAGPLQSELKALHKKHVAWLKDLKKKGKSPPEALAAYVDASVANLSSIVVLAECGGKTMLLTGDARGDKILQGLALTKLLGPGNSTLKVDVLKVPHHGSDHNVEQNFFERVIADHYVFSGNGEHGNPERQVLEMLREARGADDYRVHLTYPIEETDEARKADWKKEQAKEKARQKTKPDTKVRPNWSARKHSLAALLRDQKAFAKKIRIVDQKQPHVIDLLDKLGF